MSHPIYPSTLVNVDLPLKSSTKSILNPNTANTLPYLKINARSPVRNV